MTMTLPNSKRLRITMAGLLMNYIMFVIAMWRGADMSDLGAGLALLNSPLYVYIIGESWTPSKKEDV